MIRVNYMYSSIIVADVKIKKPADPEVLRKLARQFDFLWTHLFYCTKYYAAVYHAATLAK